MLSRLPAQVNHYPTGCRRKIVMSCLRKVEMSFFLLGGREEDGTTHEPEGA
jgi:hypothetical protein